MEAQKNKINSARIKDIFKLRTEENSGDNLLANDDLEEKMTYQQWGFVQAGKNKAAINALEPCLYSVVQSKKIEMANDEQLQQKHRAEVEQQIADLNGDKAVNENDLKSTEETLSFEEKKIEEYKREIDDIKADPTKVLNGESPSKANFIIGSFIILMLTIYLFVFYSSASYSAFFKIFTIEDGAVDAIFDAQAMSKALDQSITELLLICLIPAIFLGLGYLIHRFSNERKKQKGSSFSVAMSILITIFLLTVTFMFDAILAYSIDEKIYELNKYPGDPNFSVSIAASDVRFWLIIFSGFVVYLIWGLVFNFVMDAYYKLDKVRNRINVLESKITESKKQCKSLKEKIQELKNMISKIDAQINKKKIENNQNIFTPDAIALEINNFVTGWLSYMNTLGTHIDVQNEVRLVANKVIDNLQ